MPNWTVTRFAATSSWAAVLRFDASGTPAPAGYTVTKLYADRLTTVTVSTAAGALAGTPGTPTIPTRIRRSVRRVNG